MTFSSHLYRANPMVVNSISKVLHLVGCRERETAVVHFWTSYFVNWHKNTHRDYLYGFDK